MADESTGLGKIITGEKGRDAVHIAITPARSFQKLFPGQAIKVSRGAGGEVVEAATDGKGDGIVDPFLTAPVFEGQYFWMWMQPGSITSLRHEWTHPALDGPFVTEKTRESSEAWLRDFVRRSDCPDYETIIAAITGASLPGSDDDDYISSRWDGEYLHFDGRDAHGEIPPEFWDHIEVVTGKKIQPEMRSAYFSCSC